MQASRGDLTKGLRMTKQYSNFNFNSDVPIFPGSTAQCVSRVLPVRAEGWAGGSCCAPHHRLLLIHSESHSPGPVLQAEQVVAPLAPEHSVAVMLLLSDGEVTQGP